MSLNEDDIREILRLIDESDVEELRIETDALSLHVLRGSAAASGVDAPAPAPAEATSPSAAPASAGPVAEGGRAEESAAEHLLTVSAPMLGTFYRAEAPGAPPFVDVGARVEPDTVVCLIEVMKMMNSIHAGVTGTIVEVCAANAELVEYGAPLFQVDPDR